MRAPLLLALLCACAASERRAGDALASERVRGARSGGAPAAPIRQPTATELAARAKDDLDCAREVRTLEGERRPDAAWALIEACAEAGKWRDLRRVLAEPALFDRPEPERLRRLAQVLANRGAQFEQDLSECQRARVRLYGLPDAFAAGGLPVGSWVVFTAELRGPAPGGALELAELRRTTTDKKRRTVVEEDGVVKSKLVKVGSVDGFAPTGTVVLAHHAGAPLDLPSGQRLMFLATLRGTSAEAAAIVELAGVYRASVAGVD